MFETQTIDHLGQPIEVITSTGILDAAIAALANREPLSVVRMSDGERKILDWCHGHPPNSPMLEFNDSWRKRYGVDGINCRDMQSRLEFAAKDCTYFAADGGEEFFLKYFAKREPFAEIYFPHRWTREQRKKLLAAAGTVAVVNRDLEVANAITCSKFSPLTAFQKLNTFFGYLPDWTRSNECIRAIAKDSAPLVLVSAGPASKFIIPEIAKQGKVVLDMGSGAPHFWCVRGNPECGNPKCRAVAKEA